MSLMFFHTHILTPSGPARGMRLIQVLGGVHRIDGPNQGAGV